MAGRRGARAGRGWDAIPPRHPRDKSPYHADADRDASDRAISNHDVSDQDFADSGLRHSGFGDSGFRDGDLPNSDLPRRGRDSSDRRDSSRGRRGRPGEAADRPAQPPKSEAELAREICLRQLAVRPRTRAELAKILTRKEISEEVVAEVLDRYDEVGIIDDAAFARAWVSSRHHGRGLARRALANELRQRGVDAEVATEALESLDEEEEAATARTLVERKLRAATGTPDQIFRRLVGMLARKGYPAGVAIRAVKDALAARDAEAAEFADQIDPDALADHEAGNPS
ncbi:regulatory protein RecX [Actinoplanes sp. NPDC049548]|uniref:regulatory protein RecX n=1 Tax=Actinoplanes sp. NPDC049548 TaxID=3155152 RepID=UPI0034362057